MVKHIVLFKLRDGLDPVLKTSVMNRFKEEIEKLPSVIDWICKIEVGLNFNPAEYWDIALYSEFLSLEDVKRYSSHPDHVKAAGILADVKQDRACVDYETE